METDRRHRKPKEQITDVIHVSDTVYTICVRVPSLICLSTDTHSLLLSFRICKMGTTVDSALPPFFFFVDSCVLVGEMRIRAVIRFKGVMSFFCVHSLVGSRGHLHGPRLGRAQAAPVVLQK